MKIWRKYENYLLTGEWHVHTTYTDGKSTVFDYCTLAEREGIPLLAFTEHVRKKIDYDFDRFLEDVRRAKEECDIVILSGCEAKILPGGDIDVEESILRDVDYPIVAFHSFPKDIDLYIESLKTALKNPYINAWAHPGAFLKRYGLDIDENTLAEILKIMRDNDVLLEKNSRYNVPDERWLQFARKMGVKIVRGDDLHSVQDYYARK